MKNEWKYGVTSENELFVIPPKEIAKTTPKTLFKYYALNEHSLEVIEEKKIYASYPKILNDPFDCYHELIDFDDPGAIADFIAPIINEAEFKEQFKKDPLSFKKFCSNNFQIMFYKRIGIFSLTELPNNLLMWSYYNNHQGFCVEYDYKAFPFKFHGPFQINYSNTYKSMSIKEGWPKCLLYQASIKSNLWSHEEEWRILPETGNKEGMEVKGIDVLKGMNGSAERNFPITPECIKKVILGNRFIDNSNEFYPNGDNMNVRLKVDTKSNKKFTEDRNRLIKATLALGIPIEIMFRDKNSFSFHNVPIEVEIKSKTEWTLRKAKRNLT
ncbi:MAG: DUF2971 domain-containing protein [Vicingaceae bacterium]